MSTHRVSKRACVLVLAVMTLAAGVTLPASADSAAAPAKLIGPVLSRIENPTTTLARDGGFSTPLPNGWDFWIFADTPRYVFKQNRWRIGSVLTGSSAAMGKFAAGKPLSGPLTEVRPGEKLRSTNMPARFFPTPAAYMPDASGKRCTTVKGGPNAFSVRWPTGAALMPDKTNILVPYAIMCVFNVKNFISQGWGFALFNYKTQKFTVGPTDVWQASRSGAARPSPQILGSPIVVGKKVTFYSWECCTGPYGVYSTTVDATAAALKLQASYAPKPLPELPVTFNVHIAPKSKTHGWYTMYVLTGERGEYTIYASPNPEGPWSPVGSGVLPGCDKGVGLCISMSLHPELSPLGRLTVSYHLGRYGPGVATKHPFPRDPLRHVVMASIPCTC